MVFVEVKTRSSTLFGEPEDAITPKKQKHLLRVAYIYMRRNRLRQEDTPIRFDIVSIVAEANERSIQSIKLLKGWE